MSSKRKAKAPSPQRKTTNCFSPRSASSATASVRAGEPFGAGFGLSLAIAALDVFSQRRDFLDRSGEVFGPARLLLGRGCCFGRGTACLVGSSGDLLGAARSFLHR